MPFPLGFSDVSVLLGVMSVVLLVTSEFLSANYLNISILVNRSKLRLSAVTVSILFLVSLVARLFGIFPA